MSLQFFQIFLFWKNEQQINQKKNDYVFENLKQFIKHKKDSQFYLILNVLKTVTK